MRIHRPLVVFAFLLVLQPALALALTGAETACRDEIADALTRYTRGVAKIVTKCHDERSSGDIPLEVDCNDVGEADASERLGRAREKMSDAIAGGCAGASTLLAG